jgi:hypothetical protein
MLIRIRCGTPFVPLRRSSQSFRTLPSSCAHSPGLLNHHSKASAHATVAWVETVALTSTAKPRGPGGGEPVIAGTGSRGSAGARIPTPVTFDATIARLAGTPACRCSVCASRRASQLTQAMRNKFDPAPATWRVD